MEHDHVGELVMALHPFKGDSHTDRPITTRMLSYEEPTRDPDVWAPPPSRDPDVWLPPNPVEHKYVSTLIIPPKTDQ